MPTQSILTAREVEVFYLIAAGYSSKLIAEKLGISKKTADTFRERIIKKLRVPNSPSAVSAGIQLKILSSRKIPVLYSKSLN